MPRSLTTLVLFVAVLTASEILASDIHYQWYRAFANEHFGAEQEPLYYDHFGSTLFLLHDNAHASNWQHDAESFWLFESVNSASIAFSTSLPAITRIAYGTTTAYGDTTSVTDGYYFVHLHHLSGLNPNSQYYYKILARDERDNISDFTGTLNTGSMNGKNAVNALEGPPFIIPSSGYWILTDHVNGERGGILIDSANVTLDLNGYTVYYDSAERITDSLGNPDASYGIHALYRSNVKVFNGQIMSNATEPGMSNTGLSYSAIRFNRWDIEIAGLEIFVPQYSISAIRNTDPDTHVHHNITVNSGLGVYNRSYPEAAIMITGSGSSAKYNLIKRSNHAGIRDSVPVVYGNEVHVYSCATNGSGIGISTNGFASRNRIFGTGYHVIALPWLLADTSHNLQYLNNFVHLVGRDPVPDMTEVGSPYPNASDMIGFRITQYHGGSRDYENYLLEGNTIIVMGRSSSTISRGLQVSADPLNENFTARNNTIKVGRLDETSSPVQPDAVIVLNANNTAVGSSLPTHFYDNSLLSNTCFVLAGDSYLAMADNAIISNNLFSRYGSRSDFSTIDIGRGYQPHVIRLRLLDNIYAGGASVDDVNWSGSGTRWYWAGTSLYIRATENGGALAGAGVAVASEAVAHGSDFDDVFVTDENGIVRLHLIETTNHPAGAANHTAHTFSIAGYHPVLLSSVFSAHGTGWSDLPNDPGAPITVEFIRLEDTPPPMPGAPSPPTMSLVR